MELFERILSEGVQRYTITHNAAISACEKGVYAYQRCQLTMQSCTVTGTQDESRAGLEAAGAKPRGSNSSDIAQNRMGGMIGGDNDSPNYAWTIGHLW